MHKCYDNDYEVFDSAGYGGTHFECNEEKDGKLWINNGEYYNQVNYCPYCGFKPIIQIKKIIPGEK